MRASVRVCVRQCVYTCVYVRMHVWYAGITVPKLLQYFREFDTPAMQSCKPLPCGTGS